MTASVKQKILIDGYQIDASITEDHTFESDVTEFPVEVGSSITDNTRPKPIVVTIEGIVSDTPIGAITSIRQNDGTFTPSNEALAVLEGIREAREPVSITTTLRTFDNMVMTSLSIPRDATTGAALRFSATFTEVILVTNNRTTVRTATPSGSALNNRGTRTSNYKKLDELKDGQRGPVIKWRKGSPPGAALKPGYATADVQYREKSINSANPLLRAKKWIYAATQVELTDAEYSAFQLDMTRDDSSPAARAAAAGSHDIHSVPPGINKANPFLRGT